MSRRTLTGAFGGVQEPCYCGRLTNCCPVTTTTMSPPAELPGAAVYVGVAVAESFAKRKAGSESAHACVPSPRQDPVAARLHPCTSSQQPPVQALPDSSSAALARASPTASTCPRSIP